MFKRRFFALVAIVVVLAGAASPALADISVGQAFGEWRPFIDAIISAIAFAAVGFGVYMLYKFTGIKIEDSQRAALQQALTNAAGLLLNSLENNIKDKTITTGSPGVDRAVDYVLKAAPAAVERFGLTPADLKEKIISKVPQIANTQTPAAPAS